ncbi:AMP-binding protein, partial [Streptomyces sp. 130]|uniref:AMP-binding protein n=1 Tax=Streptomyces sp. 130 TaxID=2591006 RepID=UPI0011801F9F
LGLTDIQQLAGAGQLFDTLTVYENYPRISTASEGTDGLGLSISSAIDATHYPLTLAVNPAGDAMRLRLDYQPAALDQSQASLILARYQHLLHQLTTAADRPLAQLDMLLTGELETLDDWNGIHNPTLLSSTLPDLFAAQVVRTPDAPALVCDGGRFTYAELDARANRLARHLISFGVGPEDFVAVYLPRTADLVIALLAV